MEESVEIDCIAGGGGRVCVRGRRRGRVEGLLFVWREEGVKVWCL